MNHIKPFLVVFALLTLIGEGSHASTPCSPEAPCEECYDLTSGEAMGIMTGELAVLGDPPYIWTVKSVGGGLRCLEDCPDGDLIVSPGQFNKESCTYKITNGAPVDMIGECTTIVLKRTLQ